MISMAYCTTSQHHHIEQSGTDMSKHVLRTLAHTKRSHSVNLDATRGNLIIPKMYIKANKITFKSFGISSFLFLFVADKVHANLILAVLFQG